MATMYGTDIKTCSQNKELDQKDITNYKIVTTTGEAS